MLIKNEERPIIDFATNSVTVSKTRTCKKALNKNVLYTLSKSLLLFMLYPPARESHEPPLMNRNV